MDRLALIVSCASRTWTWRLGDPDPLGLALTAGYALVLILMVRAMIVSRFGLRRQKEFWLLATFGFAGLALNKQLDLQHMMMDTGRCFAETRGWYHDRAGLEHATALGLLVGVALVALVALIRYRRLLGPDRMLIAGLALLCLYVLLQMADTLHLDQGLRPLVDNVGLHRAIEALALATLGAAAIVRARG